MIDKHIGVTSKVHQAIKIESAKTGKSMGVIVAEAVLKDLNKDQKENKVSK